MGAKKVLSLTSGRGSPSPKKKRDVFTWRSFSSLTFSSQSKVDSIIWEPSLLAHPSCQKRRVKPRLVFNIPASVSSLANMYLFFFWRALFTDLGSRLVVSPVDASLYNWLVTASQDVQPRGQGQGNFYPRQPYRSYWCFSYYLRFFSPNFCSSQTPRL